MQWIGQKRVAFIPLHRPGFDPDPPNDWGSAIERKIYYQTDARNGNLSLRNYIHTVSSGLADVVGGVFPMEEVAQLEVEVDALEYKWGDKLRQLGFDGAALVAQGTGASVSGRAQAAGFWARFDFGGAATAVLGVWAMELIHLFTGYWDLYIVENNLSTYDNMACACGSHPCAFTKRAVGWLDPEAVATGPGRFRLYDVGLVQPPPQGQYAAVEVRTETDTVMVEARERVDIFDANITGGGVIVYSVRNPDADPNPDVTKPLIDLLTPVALGVGQSFTSPSGVAVRVTDRPPDGFAVEVEDPARSTVPDLYEMSKDEARTAVQEAGLRAAFTGSGDPHAWCSKQAPTKGSVVARGDTVKITMSKPPPP